MTKTTPAAKMQNALRIMYSLDEVASVLPADKVEGFHRSPMETAIRMDNETWAKVYALIEARNFDQEEPAAPDLLEALTALVDDEDVGNWSQYKWDNARAAIAKARGEK